MPRVGESGTRGRLLLMPALGVAMPWLSEQVVSPPTHLSHPQPPPFPLQPPPLSIAPVYLDREQQSRVMVQTQNTCAVSDVVRRPDGGMEFISEHKGIPHPAKSFECLPLIDALIKKWPKANKLQPFKANGMLKDQGWYLVSYNVLNIPYTSTVVYQEAAQDQEFVSGYRYDNLSNIGFRLFKSSPTMLARNMVIKYVDQVVGTLLMIDGDNADMWPKSRYPQLYKSPDQSVVEKLPWSQELFDLFKGTTLPCLKNTVPWWDKCTCFYTTANGWRWVAQLTTPIAVTARTGSIEDHVAGMMIDLALAGVGVDSGCRDWTRHMRVPRCYKGDTALDSLTFFRCSYNGIDLDDIGEEPPEKLIAYPHETYPTYSGRKISDYFSHENFPLIQKAFGTKDPTAPSSFHASVNVSTGDMPSAQDVEDILYNGDRRNASIVNKVVKKELTSLMMRKPERSKKDYLIAQAARLYAMLYENSDNMMEFSKAHGCEGLHYGNYYATKEFCHIFRSRLNEHSDITPQVVYAFMVGPYLKAMEQRSQVDPSNARSEDTIRGEAWRAVLAHWTMQHAIEQDIIQRDTLEEQQDVLAKEERQVLNDEAETTLARDMSSMLGLPEDWCSANLRKHLLISSGLGISVAQVRNGAMYWSDPQKKWSNVVPAIRESGHLLINLLRPKTNPEDGIEIRTEQAVMHDHGSTCGDMVRASRLTDRNRIETVTQSGEKRLRFVYKLLGMAEDIQPVYHDCIDKYFREIAGEHYEKFLDWCACFRKIDRPLPALYLKGPPGIGKGMLLEGLSQLTAAKTSAEFTDALQQFQDTWKDTPFVSIDEDASTANGKFTKNVVGVLRRLIGGHFKYVQIKGEKSLRLDGEWRLMISANNDGVLEIKQDLDDNDIEALNGRIFYIDSEPRATEIKQILRQAGGRNGNEHGPGTEADNWPLKIAQHVVWLEENRQVQHGERYLVDAPPTPWHENLRITSAGGLTVCKAIGTSLSAANEGRTFPWLHVEKAKCKVFVEPEPFERHMAQEYPKFSGQITAILGRLSHGIYRPRVKSPGPGRPRRPRCYDINIEAVMTALEHHGYDTDYRAVFGETMWRAVAPAHIQSEYQDEAMTQSVGNIIRPSTWKLNQSPVQAPPFVREAEAL